MAENRKPKTDNGERAGGTRARGLGKGRIRRRRRHKRLARLVARHVKLALTGSKRMRRRAAKRHRRITLKRTTRRSGHLKRRVRRLERQLGAGAGQFGEAA